MLHDWRLAGIAYRVELAHGCWHVRGASLSFTAAPVRAGAAGAVVIAGHTVIVQKAALVEVGGFPPATKYAADWYTYNLIGFKYGICVVPEVLAVNQINPNTFYLRGRRDKEADLEVMEAILRLWGQEKWQDAVELMRKCGALDIWGYPMLKTLLRHREYRHYLTPTFLRKNLWHITKRSLKRMGPAWLVNCYCKLSGYRAKPVMHSKGSAPETSFAMSNGAI